jgi:hypothetical protein
MEDHDMNPAEQRILSRIERLLCNGSLPAMEQAAGLILKHSDLLNLGRPFQISLMRRMGQWRQQYDIIQTNIERMDDGASGMLYRMTEVPDYQVWMHPRQHEPEQPPKRVTPSRSTGTPEEDISDGEISELLELVDSQGLEKIFANGADIINGKLVMYPLITLGERVVEYGPVAAMYAEKGIERPWDPSKRKPFIAMAFDLSLLSAMVAKRWTYRVWDDAFSRLPETHQYFPKNGNRPGWNRTTKIMELRGLIERPAARTWLLTEEGHEVASTQLAPAWSALGKPLS